MFVRVNYLDKVQYYNIRLLFRPLEQIRSFIKYN